MNLKDYFKRLRNIGYKNILAALLVVIITISVIIIFNKNNDSHRTSCHSFTVEELALSIIADDYMGGKLGNNFKSRKQLFLAFDRQTKAKGYLVKAENANFFSIRNGVCEVDFPEYLISGKIAGTFLAKDLAGYSSFRKKDFKYTYTIMYNQNNQEYTNVRVYY